MPPDSASTEHGYFAIADISGYTAYLAGNELAHAQGILAELTDLLVEQLSAPFRFVEVEGDAVFVFAPASSVEDAERLVDILEACYAAFRLLQAQMVSNTSCTCAACIAIRDLDLKCVGHYGCYVMQQTPTCAKPVGPDVILTHRLLKNDVIAKTGIEAYALLTDAFVDQTTSTDDSLGPQHQESYAQLGTVSGRVLDLARAVARYERATRHLVTTQEADCEVIADLPAPRSVVWAYHMDAGLRMRWQLDTTSIETVVGPDGRTGVGAESYCDHGNYRLNHRIIDWRPFDYMTMMSTPVLKLPFKLSPALVTFAFDELPGGRCRASMRLRQSDRRLPARTVTRLMRSAVEKSWRNHYAQLQRVLRDDAG